MAENVIVIGFEEPSKAYQALSVLKACHADGKIALESAAIVERTPEAELRIPESADNNELVGMASGSLIGTLIGVLGGPVGALLGWGAGAMMGGAFDLDRAVTSDEALTVLGQAIPTGSTAVIASVEEPAVEVIDGEMTKLGGRSPAGLSTRSWSRSRRPRKPPTPPPARRGKSCARSGRPRSAPTSPSTSGRRRRSCTSRSDAPASPDRSPPP